MSAEFDQRSRATSSAFWALNVGPACYIPNGISRRNENAHRAPQRREAAEVGGELLAGIPQRLNLGLGRRIRDCQPPNFSVRVPHRHRRLVGSGRLEERVLPAPDLRFHDADPWTRCRPPT
jgi:hypothetical protein